MNRVGAGFPADGLDQNPGNAAFVLIVFKSLFQSCKIVRGNVNYVGKALRRNSLGLE